MGLPDDGAWTEPLADGSPAGPNLEFDPDFGALDRAAQGKPEQQYGDTIIPAEEPDWKEVEEQALALLERPAICACWAIWRWPGCISPVAGIRRGAGSVRQLLETWWDEIHPQLDPEDDNDPTLRANALLRLAIRAWCSANPRPAAGPLGAARPILLARRRLATGTPRQDRTSRPKR